MVGYLGTGREKKGKNRKRGGEGIVKAKKGRYLVWGPYDGPEEGYEGTGGTSMMRVGSAGKGPEVAL